MNRNLHLSLVVDAQVTIDAETPSTPTPLIRIDFTSEAIDKTH